VNTQEDPALLAAQLALVKRRLVETQSVANVGSWETDLPTLEVTWTEETFRIFEVSPETFRPTHKAFLALVHPEDRDRVDEAFLGSFGSVGPQTIEHRLLLPDGRIKFVEERWRAFPDETGALTRAVGTCQDVTARRAASEALAESERRYHDLVEASPDLIWTVDREGRFTFLNRASRAVYGRDPEEMIGRPFHEFMPPEQRAAAADELARLLGEGADALGYTNQIVRKSGEVAILVSNARTIRDAKGRVVGVAGMSRDKTEAVQAQEAMRASAELLRIAGRTAHLGGWTVDLPEVRLMWSDEVCAIHDMPAGTVPDVDQAIAFYAPESRPIIEDAFGACVRDGVPFDLELQLITAKGRRVWVRSIGHAERDAAGAIRRVQGAFQDITQQRRTAEALQASLEDFRSLAEAVPQIVWITGADGGNIYVNQLWLDYTGLTAEESHGQGWSKPIHPDDQLRAVEAWQGATSRGAGFSLEVRLRRADGEYRWWLMRGRPQKDAAGAVAKWFGTCTDIQDIKVAQLEITRTNRALKMLSACNEALIHAEHEGRLLERICEIAVATGGYRMAWVGYAHDDPQKSISHVAHAGEEAGYLADLKLTWSETEPHGRGPAGRSIRTGKVVFSPDIERDPSFIWLEAARARGYRAAISLPLRQGERTFGLLGLYSADVLTAGPEELKLLQELADDLAFGIGHLRAQHEARRMQEAVREQAELLDKAQDAIVVRDLDHRITYWNKSAERLYGWSAAEAIGRPLQELLSLEPAVYAEATAQVMAQGEWYGEVPHVRKDSRQLTIQGRWTLVRDDAGRPRSILSINTDITERKRLESKFLRTQRLESLGTLASGIAHDLNNALTPIMMSSELLLLDYPTQSEVLDIIRACTKRGAEMVRQLLSYAKGAEGARAPVHTFRLLDELEKLMKGSFPKNIELVVRGDPGLPAVLGDATQLHQVLLNLCVNARDAMPGGGTLTLEAERRDVDELYASSIPDSRPGKYVLLRVRDTGAGIPRSNIERIFDPFFTTKGPDKGTGLGLSTVMGIVKGHGGFVQVYSQVGQGSTFTVYLPAEGDARDADPRGRAVEQFLGNGEIVLLVDDEPVVREMGRRVLQQLNFTPVTASDGMDGLVKAVEHRAALRVIVTDLHMPHMDGLAFVRGLRRTLPDLPVVVASGMMEEAVAEEFRRLGVASRLDKPYTQEQLATTLKRILAPR